MKGRRARGIWREKSQTSAIAIQEEFTYQCTALVYFAIGHGKWCCTNLGIEHSHLQPKPMAHLAGDLHLVGERGMLCRLQCHR